MTKNENNTNYKCLITKTPVSIVEATDFVLDDSHGAVCQFLGVVRNQSHGKEVLGIEYDVCFPLAEDVLVKIAKKALNETPKLKIYIAHMAGFLKVGEASLIVNTSSPHREDAYKANRFIVESIKQQAPVWKKEFYVDNSHNWVKGCKIKHEYL